jgi:hypothetical protein
VPTLHVEHTAAATAAFGGERALDELEDDAPPRIC